LTSTSTQRTEEGFRVLTLKYPMTEDVRGFIERYRALASHFYWSRRLGLEPASEVVEELWRRVPSYWRWHLVDPRDPLYLFKGVEGAPAPSRILLGLPLVDALHENKGAYIKDDKLVLRLNRKVELDIPERALKWLEKRLAEGPDKKFVRVLERGDRLVVQVVLHKANRVEMPRDPLLVVVDVNSSYGVVVHFWDGKLIKTVKLRPPNRGNGWGHVRELMSHRDLLYNQGCLSQGQINVYSALARLTLKGSMRVWEQQAAAEVVKRVRRMARRHGKEPLVIIDRPDYSSLHGTPLQRTLYGFTRRLENLLSWYGVYWEERRLYSTVCPICGGRLVLVRRTRRTRVMECVSCGFREDRDNVPLYWAIRNLSALKGEASNWG